MKKNFSYRIFDFVDICSAYHVVEDDIAVKTSDIAAFIIKPVDLKELKQRYSS